MQKQGRLYPNWKKRTNLKVLPEHQKLSVTCVHLHTHAPPPCTPEGAGRRTETKYILRKYSKFSQEETQTHRWLATYLKSIVFVKGPSREQGDQPQGSHIHILTGKEEERHRAAIGHTVLGQRFIDSCLGLEKYLRKKMEEMKSYTVFFYSMEKYSCPSH